MNCTLRRCQGKKGCICPAKPPIGAYGSPATRSASQEVAPVVPRRKAARTPSKSVKIPSKLPPIKGAVKSPVTSPSKKSPTISTVSSATPDNSQKDNTTTEPIATSDTASNQVASSSNGDGNVTICYNHYKKQFPIAGGSTNSEVIDAEYYLSFAFPNSKVHLSKYAPSDFSFEDEGITERPLISENPPGTYHGLEAEAVYWVVVEEDAEERKAYEKRQDEYAQQQAERRKAEEASETAAGAIKKERAESCSCIEGNPCMDKYGCKDWDNRYTVAKKNGWKGF